MKTTIVITAAIALAATAALAGTEDVKFPAGYGKDYVLYHTVNKPNKKRGNTFRKFFINKEALAAFKSGGKLPSGTVIVREDWYVRESAGRVPVRGADGNFVATFRKGVEVMEKRDGWGAGYPAAKRNGNWEYASFKSDGKRRTTKVGRCFGCHMKMSGKDFVFSSKALAEKAK